MNNEIPDTPKSNGEAMRAILKDVRILGDITKSQGDAIVAIEKDIVKLQQANQRFDERLKEMFDKSMMHMEGRIQEFILGLTQKDLKESEEEIEASIKEKKENAKWKKRQAIGVIIVCISFSATFILNALYQWVFYGNK